MAALVRNCEIKKIAVVGFFSVWLNNLKRLNGDFFITSIKALMGRYNSVGIATRYGLDGSGIEFRWGRDFPRPSRPALGPT